LHDRLDDGAGIVLGEKIMDEGAVDLDSIDRKSPQGCSTTNARCRNHPLQFERQAPEAAATSHARDHLIPQKHRLRNLELKPVGGQAGTVPGRR
jgi:hypothetical protein